jgi:hypothetical protein
MKLSRPQLDMLFKMIDGEIIEPESPGKAKCLGNLRKLGLVDCTADKRCWIINERGRMRLLDPLHLHP